MGRLHPSREDTALTMPTTERSTVRKVLALSVSALFFLSACSGDGGEAGKAAGQDGVFDSVKVKVEDSEKAPEVEFDAPLDITESAAKIVYTGDGDTIAEGQSITFKFVALNADDASVLGDTYDQTASALPVTEELKAQDPALYEVLLGAKVGSQIAYAFPEAQAEAGSGDQPTQVMILNVLSAQDTVAMYSREEAQALEDAGDLRTPEDEVASLDEEGKLPTVGTAEDGTPALEVEDTSFDPDKLIVKVIEEGDGPVAGGDSTVLVDYQGVSLRDGEAFDSSYSRGEAAEFSLEEVVPGWTFGLSGVKAGSKVLLVLPSELGYGDPAQSATQPSGPLAFYVDLKEVK